MSVAKRLALFVFGVVLVAAAPAQAGVEEEVALFDPATGQWHFRGPVSSPFFYGLPGDVPLLGDWDCDGTETVGMFRTGDGFAYLRNSNDFGVADLSFFYGIAGDVPIAGDWDGDGCDSLAIYRDGRVFISNRVGTGFADFSYYFGVPGDLPFAGDFDGDGIDTIGLYRESSGLVYFRNSHTLGVAEFEFFYGVAGDRIVAGDWDGDGDDTVGLFRPADAHFHLSNENRTGFAETEFSFGEAGWLPVAGDVAVRTAQLRVDPATVDFGTAGIGAPLTRTIDISFDGADDDLELEIRSVRIEGAGADAYSVEGPGAATIGFGGRDAIDVTFAPGSLGAKPARVVIRFAGANSPLTIPMAGTGAYRINAGGPSGAAPGWSGDAGPAPSPYVSGTTAAGPSAAAPVDPGETGVPPLILRRYRFGLMRWDFPVDPGLLEVRLYFAETFPDTQAAGARVFDVTIEGVQVIDDLDIYAEVGGFAGLVRTFQVVSDANLDVDFDVGVNSPAVQAIEILRTAGTGLGASPGVLDFGSVAVGTTATRTIDAINLAASGGPALAVESVAVTGAGFSIAGPQSVVLAPGQSAQYSVTFRPTTPGEQSGTVTIGYAGGALTVPVTGASDDVIAYRVNAGGAAIPGTIAWNSDSGFVTGATGENTAFLAVDVADPSIPLSTPAAMLASERFGDMQWDFPLGAGEYEIRLYFAEIFHTEAGERLFHVDIEGDRVLGNYDVLADAGGPFIGIMRPFRLSSPADGVLDIDFTSISDQAKVSGIEIYRIQGPANLSADPPGVNFGPLPTGATEMREVVIENAGAAGSPTITLSQASAEPPFSATVPQVILPPGNAITVPITFVPVTGGTHSAGLTIAYDQPSSPLVVQLTGRVNNPPVLVNPGPQTVAEGAAFSLTLDASEPDGDPFVISVSGLPPWAFFTPATRTISGVPGFADAGTSTVTATASDGTLTTAESFLLEVTETNRAPVVVNPGPQVAGVGVPFSLTIQASDPDGDSLNLTAAGLPPWATFNAATRNIFGTPATTGSWTVTVTASDGELSAGASFVIEAVAAAPGS